ncbi:uncharacterized protein LOC112346283 [Selaginella moellendorffii]|uniref:uncharacterized protein LOC112346283 n=1 Tax=Selaginella moellendorffii TaxID=88036 RepID=UPI000D1CD8C3|nr:uncharacterized protein LOC112346283 [Selaginella moellendorffii]|eukprot:XP_024530669.1 uncharacterized protein LOC112346283 [Selaginella moellendorffii]
MERSALLLSIPPLVFCDTCKEGKEKKDFLTGSYSNPYEAETVCSFVKLLISKMISGSQIGVIALYKSQESLIRQMLYPKDACVGFGRKKETAHSEVENVKVSTVDAFQGLEKDVIILSCCRTAGLGFLASKQRLNVALTRARHHLLIIGSASNLQRNSLWEELLEPLRRNPNTFRSSEDMKKALLGCSEAGCSSDGSKDSIDSTAGLAVLNPPPSISFELDSLFDEDDVSLKKLLEVLDDVNFRPRDFWQGYKLYCIGHYSHSQSHQDEFAQTLMADVIRTVHGMSELQWGGKFDKFVRSTWSTMEEYIKRRHGVNCGDIRFLIREYDDSQALAASEHGSFFFKMCEDETPFPRETNPDEREKPRQDETNSVIDSLMGQLSSMDERLAKLVK